MTIDFNADVDRALAVMLEEVSRDRPRIVKGRKPGPMWTASATAALI